MGGLHLEALYPAVGAVLVAVIALVGRRDRGEHPDVNMTTLVDALGRAEHENSDLKVRIRTLETEVLHERTSGLAWRDRAVACEAREQMRGEQ